MCLDTITKKPRKHEVGYKLFETHEDHYISSVLGCGKYYIGKTYNALDENNPLPIAGTYEYPAGFHYFLIKF